MKTIKLKLKINGATYLDVSEPIIKAKMELDGFGNEGDSVVLSGLMLDGNYIELIATNIEYDPNEDSEGI